MHLQLLPSIPAVWRDDALAAKWDQLRAARRVVTGALERARADKVIGASLQAQPQVYITAPQKTLLESIDFAGLCIASSLVLLTDATPPEAFRLPDVPDIAVVVRLAPGKECERCWQVLPEVGEHADHPLLCERCHDVMTHPASQAA